MTIASKVRARMLQRIDFPNEDILVKVEALAAASAALSSAGEQFDDVYAEGEAASDDVAEGILGLSNAVASPDRNEASKAFFAKVFTAATPEQERAGEELFNAALDFDVAANDINALFTDPAE